MNKASAPPGIGNSLHALVVEDDMLIMLDIEEVLTSIGISKVSCATSIEGALKILESQTPDFALLDFHVGKSTSLTLVAKLQNMKVPFVLVTALIMSQGMSSDFANIPLISKPFTEADIRNAVEQLLAKRER
jgi:two-component SAPR family response regulator